MGVVNLLILEFLIGGIPFGFLAVYLAKGSDIRSFGSGNIGATNVTRILGKKWGILVFILDFLKGFLAPLIVPFFVSNPPPLLFILAVIAVVCGHNWTPFLQFKGGKGVSASLGGIAGLSLKFFPLLILFIISIFVWSLVFFIFKIVSIASLAGAFAFFIFSLVFALPGEFKIFAFLLFILILVRHKKNIKGLIEDNELRF
jgi:glycerol-3-phosphate acyltransferase PlsY